MKREQRFSPPVIKPGTSEDLATRSRQRRQFAAASQVLPELWGGITGVQMRP